MSLFDDDYISKMNRNIELSKLLFGLSEENAQKVYDLYLEKDRLLKSGSFFSSFKVKRINKKINKIRSTVDKSIYNLDTFDEVILKDKKDKDSEEEKRILHI